jgi:hypothetical protein
MRVPVQGRQVRVIDCLGNAGSRCREGIALSLPINGREEKEGEA